MRGASLVVRVLVVGVTGAACSDTVALRWRLSFSTAELRERAAFVEATIRRGRCDSTEVIYEARFAPDERPTTPPSLSEGQYAFVARVRDPQCRWFASGCTSQRLPLDGDGEVVIELSPEAAPELDCSACSACPGGVDAGSDATTIDAGVVDADPSDASDAPAPSPRVTLQFEAESATSVLAPLAIHPDESASGGEYISYPYDETLTEPATSFRRNEPPPPDGDGIATYHFDVDRPGEYRLWARVITPTLDDDSFWFQMDEGEWILWNDVAHANAWQWVDVRAFESRTQMLFFPLDAGPHTLRVSYRELNAKLDVLLLTNDASYIPGP